MFSIPEYFYLFVLSVLLYFGYLIYKSYQPPLSSKNKAVFVTGCDTGFGHLFAQRMAERNYRVFAGCLFPEGDGANKLKAFSSKIEIVPLDVTNEQSIKRAAEHIEINLGTDDVLWAIVNNAGLGHAGELEWTPMETILKLFNVNVFGMVRVTQEFLPLLRKSKGRIVNLTSMAAVTSIISMVPYCMSKSAASTFSDGIRLEMRKWNIKVINVQPYMYSTNLTSEDSVKSYFNQSWKNANPKNTSALGDEYFEKYLKKCNDISKLLKCNRVEDVIWCLEDAVTSPAPKLYYRPGNLTNKISFTFVRLFPPSLEELFYNLAIKFKF
ncbi:short-chain dehydrogenase/reductase family 9C member 7-like isoform X1 [Centruroides sculpturatus]|uniref:short-chain dehydrogenase/reductase family 9C member 7-like isoform X1 n=1 Tax=Centruroides sculpturatus TaxID=218467 RepID=UPI000C6CBED8|nr:short-chain dehydrogenase/reductase family 9C member 7-like isoform X1 [Centruroides sculpturatus]XP_023228799.1 short-chain dehydrogenase/reductase family 9C member 7-like isoform X1 [Centruroides sculpturatus]XP_023228800.1 short-chain dehydrogenase/reductase family 9C member 7-like isoform X1 [Centruroides sculpturatus]